MGTALASGLLLGLSCGLSPGPLMALLVTQTLRHGTREGCKIALVPFLSDTPIIVLVLALATQLEHFRPALGALSVAGAIFLLFLAWETGRSAFAQEKLGEASAPKSWTKGVVTNLLNPHPWLFWMTVGAATLGKIAAQSRAAAGMFLGTFYLGLVGSKIIIALLLGRSRHLVFGRTYRVTLFCLALLLVIFSGLLFAEGWREFHHAQ